MPQKAEPEHCERRTKRKRNQQELDFERQEDNAHGYTSLESTMPVQFTEVRDKIGVDSDMDKIIDDDPSPIIEAGLTPLNSKCLILYVLIFQETIVYLEDDENALDRVSTSTCSEQYGTRTYWCRRCSTSLSTATVVVPVQPVPKQYC